MRCAELMQTEVIACKDDDPIETAALQMRDERVGFLPVKDADGTVIGAITDRDIAIRAVAEARDPKETPVGDVMTREIYFCRPGDRLKEAEDLMVRRHIRRVMILDDAGKLVGVLSLSDLGRKEWGWRVARTIREVSRR